ncbi:Di-and tricarboxylate transporter [Halogranum gelatinilyticum]|uniref:Di-and tricarboxylate transporter n=1 Tax=Halogranum gelatinilyticum TaxID=660521 RepID=A0A1G9PYA0_9EURY|nr:SLC13 family permease [Halogranum gelatinilyticum]SDM03792.1 Di-and tricarboxylate transporter [Halogranum gelatinilyticum]
MVVFGLPTGTVLVFALILVTVALFVSELLPPDIVAIGIIVALVVLGPWTGISPEEGLSGFSNAATVTILAMYVLSQGIQETGIVRRLGVEVARVTRGSESRLLTAVVGLTGPIAGVINNTPVVAVFIPMVTDLADDAGISPSKLLLPLSYASMLGGTLTLIGTATNLVASDLAVQLGRENPGLGLHGFSMFEFTKLGAVVLVVGGIYLLTVGRLLTPARIPPGDRTARFEVEPFLARVLVTQRSPLVGTVANDVIEDAHRDLDVDILDVVRGDQHFIATEGDRTIEGRDILTVRGSPETIQQFCDLADLRILPRASVTDAELDNPERATLVELVVPSRSSLVGETISGTRLRERYDATVLAVRRAGGDLVREGLGGLELAEGDALLVQTTDETADYLGENDDFLVTSEMAEELLQRERERGLSPTTVPALAIVFGVIALAAAGLVPIVIAALGGVVAMVATGVLSPSDAYDAVNWNVVFLLAGVIPLGLAMQETGGAALLAQVVVGGAENLPVLVVLALFYLLTGLLANVITPVASVVLLLPIAVDTAARIDANAFAFVLGVTFAASTAFMTPVGYQTNLMVYGPGGYRFTDYVRVGAPLQLLLTVVTTVGIWFFWGLTPPV